jgi:hypothetical protein
LPPHAATSMTIAHIATAGNAFIVVPRESCGGRRDYLNAS